MPLHPDGDETDELVGATNGTLPRLVDGAHGIARQDDTGRVSGNVPTTFALRLG